MGPGHHAQIHRARGRERIQPPQLAHVVADGHPGLDDAGVGQQARQLGPERPPGKLHQINGPARGQLHQGRRVEPALAERGTGLGIEAQHLFPRQIRQGLFPVFQTAHQMDGPFVMAQGQGVDFVAAQAATQTFQIHAVRGFVS